MFCSSRSLRPHLAQLLSFLRSRTPMAEGAERVRPRASAATWTTAPVGCTVTDRQGVALGDHLARDVGAVRQVAAGDDSTVWIDALDLTPELLARRQSLQRSRGRRLGRISAFLGRRCPRGGYRHRRPDGEAGAHDAGNVPAKATARLGRKTIVPCPAPAGTRLSRFCPVALLVPKLPRLPRVIADNCAAFVGHLRVQRGASARTWRGSALDLATRKRD
ncbi:hypothetical protein SAMN05444722_0772 [Rhodovulum sp. ES.010]|nr:hypothetical protein SAMN05444722_0772 [Rhodovulum sp. ES.010]